VYGASYDGYDVFVGYEFIDGNMFLFFNVKVRYPQIAVFIEMFGHNFIYVGKMMGNDG
tara:strand:- start:76 stop:249 length:174 start_codon:yes stop_codon:yes gene_type:complete